MKKLIYKGIFNLEEIIYESIYENERKWRKRIQDAERLAEELQKYRCLYENGNEGYKERPEGKCMESS